MAATLRELDSQDRRVYSIDPAKERWNQRMSLSLITATAMHAAVFGFWPIGARPASPELIAMDPGPPTFINLYDLPVGDDLPEGTLAIPERSGALAPLDPNAPPEKPGATEEDLRDLEEDLRDRLVRGQSYVPQVANSQEFDGANGSPTDNNNGVGGARGVASNPNSQAFEALRGLSAIDMERLAALRPDVALEAASNWVLVRNPSEVWDYMRRNSDPQDRDEGSVQVALWVSSAGSVEWAEVIGSSGRADLDDIALTLFSKVVSFRPARLEGVPMPMSAIFTINFPWF